MKMGPTEPSPIRSLRNVFGRFGNHWRQAAWLSPALLAFTSLLATPSQAYNQDDLDTLNNTGSCAGAAAANGTYCDLTNSIHSGQNLASANLTNATLTNANLNSATLTNANLTGASLYSLYLDGTILDGATLTNANLELADLYEVTLDGAIFCNTTMPDGSIVHH